MTSINEFQTSGQDNPSKHTHRIRTAEIAVAVMLICLVGAFVGLLCAATRQGV